MTKTFNTNLGKVTLRSAMLDINGTDLVEGVVIKIDGKLAGEVVGIDFDDVKDMTIKEVEKFTEENCNI